MKEYPSSPGIPISLTMTSRRSVRNSSDIVKNDVEAVNLAGIPIPSLSAARGSLFQLCVKLEVALAESVKLAERLRSQMQDLLDGNDPGQWPSADDAGGGIWSH